MRSPLQITSTNKNMKPTPETDQWETYCDECYYHMWRLRRKNERGWNDGFQIHTGEEAKGLCDLLNNLERQRDEARKETIRWMSIAEGRGRTDDDDTGKAMAKLIRQRDEARGQRDRLAEALRMITTFDYKDLQCDNGHGARSVATEALQSLFCDALQSITQPTEP